MANTVTELEEPLTVAFPWQYEPKASQAPRARTGQGRIAATKRGFKRRQRFNDGASFGFRNGARALLSHVERDCVVFPVAYKRAFAMPAPALLVSVKIGYAISHKVSTAD